MASLDLKTGDRLVYGNRAISLLARTTTGWMGWDEKFDNVTYKSNEDIENDIASKVAMLMRRK